MKRVATIILNRNLPGPTDRLYEHLCKFDSAHTDIFVVEAGSDPERLSRYCTWYNDDPEVLINGLRYGRGMNFGLLNLYRGDNRQKYDAFFLLTNDTELYPTATLAPLLDILDRHPRVGILSPCSRRWGEKFLLDDVSTKYFWFIHNNALLLRRQFVDCICERLEPNLMNFLFDGSNFRGYLSESELIAKGYANDWSAAITTNAYAEENESYLLEQSDLIKTNSFEDNLELYLDEGMIWMKRKYGFSSRWSMQRYVKNLYDDFFDNFPDLKRYKL